MTQGRSEPATRQAEPSGFFVLRTPLLPFRVVADWSAGLEAPGCLDDPAALDEALASDRMRLRRRLEDIVAEPGVRDAVYVASPSLESAIDVWRKDPDGDRGRRAERSLVCYLMRAAVRPTPFGLFAGCTTGTIGADTSLRLHGRDRYLRHTRLDMDYLWTLAEAVERDPALREGLTYQPNSSLYEVGDRLLFAESYASGDGRRYRLVAVDKTPYLMQTITLAREGASLASLAEPLTSEEVSRAEAEEYLGDLVDAQLLVADVRPQLTGPPPADTMAATLARDDRTAPMGRLLAGARVSLAAIDASGLGAPAERYRAVARILDALPAAPEASRLVQVDLTKPAESAVLGAAVVAEMRRGADILHAVARHRPDEALKQFMEQFARRYETREMPLASVLDEETGIGFGMSGAASAEAAPLLAGLPFQRRNERQASWTRRDDFLHRKLAHALANGKREITIGSAEADAIREEDMPPLPAAYEVLGAVIAESAEAAGRGDFQVAVHSASGPSGARLLGRFCHADDELRHFVQAHLRAEESARPECVFAEIVHQPEGRIGNILSRPVLRGHEIAYLGRSGAPPDRQLPLSDLTVSVSGNRIVLRSSRLGCEVVPRLTTAHNHARGGLGAYRFLCALQRQDVTQGVTWDWGPLHQSPYLPRVVSGRVILSRACWNLREPQLAAFREPRGSAQFTAVQLLRADAGLPRYVALVDADNELAADLDNILSVEALAHQIGRRPAARLVELVGGPDRLCVAGPEGLFIHQIIVPFVRSAPAPAPEPERDPDQEAARPRRKAAGSVRVTARPAPRAGIARRFPPGSEWLYLKLFTGPATADLVLSRISPILAASVAAGTIDGWHFIRYGDPDWHLRLRLHGAPEALLGDALPRLRRRIAPLVETGQIWRIQLDTYEREVERYGGAGGIELAERIFQADSEAVLALIRQLPGDAGAELRWRAALLGIDLLFDDLGLTSQQKRATARGARLSYEHEFRTEGTFQRAISDRYRLHRPSLEAMLAPDGDQQPELVDSVHVLRRRSAAVAAVTREMRAAAGAGALSADLPALALSFAHMHVNRLLRSAQRAQELVLYEMLDRVYGSRAARPVR